MPQSAGKRPGVSIIVPVYNAESYLGRCLDSILAQTLADWECVCVDDGSTDGSPAILKEYAEKDSRFVVIRRQNGGVASARNTGLDAARGEYIGFVDSDDWIEPETYELALNAARQSGADLVQWRSVAERKGGSVPSRELAEGFFDVRENLAYYSVVVWNKLFKASLLIQNQIRFPQGLYTGEDLCVGILSYACAKKAYFLDRPLYHHVARDASVSHNKTAEMCRKERDALEEAFAAVKEKHSDWYNGGGHRLFFCKSACASNGRLTTAHPSLFFRSLTRRPCRSF